MGGYVDKVLKQVKARDTNQPEFVQSVEEVFSTLGPIVESNPIYEKNYILERMAEPERTIVFRVVYRDDNGECHVHRGYRVQFNGAIGPYKGGLRFAPNVNMSIMKFLGFEQSFKDSLTGLPIGGAKGGADFDPTGKSDEEIMRFCQSFMTELYRHIGHDEDVPAGDMGVGAREIGYLFGQYRRIVGHFENGVLTGKGLSYGGSLIRPEATGFGAVYYLEETLKHDGTDLKGKTIAVSGFGNVAWGVCKKAAELGGKVVTLSGPDGYIYDPDGVCTDEKINYLLTMRDSNRNKVKDYADKFGVQFFEGKKPWGQAVDIVMPCAMQNDVNMDTAELIARNGVPYYIEVANMPTTNEALRFFEDRQANGLMKAVAPCKAVNAGGVATSALEMSQNAEKLSWTAEEVDGKLHQIMKNIYNNSVLAAEKYGEGYNLVAGANLYSFQKIADAMIAQGIF